MKESEWADEICARLGDALPKDKLNVACKYPVSYRGDIRKYDHDDKPVACFDTYQTDILISELLGSQGDWIPRVVIECKLGSVTTHDALTYSAKAETHKHLHKYLRYGMLVGNWGDQSVPWRLFQHGSHFDFMLVWSGTQATAAEWETTMDLMQKEIEASSEIEAILFPDRKAPRRIRAIRRGFDTISEAGRAGASITTVAPIVRLAHGRSSGDLAQPILNSPPPKSLA